MESKIAKLLESFATSSIPRVNMRRLCCLWEYHEPPILAFAINEGLGQLAGRNSSSVPTVVAPFFLESSKLKGESKSATKFESKCSLYGLEIGSETAISKAMVTKTQKPQPSLQTS